MQEVTRKIAKITSKMQDNFLKLAEKTRNDEKTS